MANGRDRISPKVQIKSTAAYPGFSANPSALETVPVHHVVIKDWKGLIQEMALYLQRDQ